MKLFFFARVFYTVIITSVCFLASAQTGWAVKQTFISDNLKDVRFFGNYGLLIGNHGLYYNTTGVDNPAGWKKYIISTSTADSILLSDTKFVQLAFTGQSTIFFAAGTDTVSNRAILFRLNLSDSSYTFPFTGNPGSAFNSIAAVDYYYGSGYIITVGDHGLVVSYEMATNNVSQSSFHDYANLQMIYSRSRYNGHAAIISNDSIFSGTAATQFIPDFGQTIGHHVQDAFGDDNSTTVYLLDSLAAYNAILSSSSHWESGIVFKPTGLRFHSISPAVAGSLRYVATDKGIYKLFQGTTLEYQPGSQGMSLNKIWFNQKEALDTGYAVGPNGLLLKTVNLGGPVKPYAQLTSANGGCVNEYYSLTGQHGSGTSCKWYFDGNFLQDYCGTSPYYISTTGNHELKYIVANADGVSDTSLKIISITAKPQINLPFVASDTILCKSEPIQVQISNTQNGHRYDLIQASSGNSFGSVAGNGGLAELLSSYISDSGFYFIRATNIVSGCSANFTSQIMIRVEKTKSRFSPDKINVAIGEKFNLFNNCTDAISFQWMLQQDANISASTSANPPSIFYSSIGQKTLTLISTSQYGCKDTATADVVFVYEKPDSPDKCYSVDVSDSDYSYIYTSYPDVGSPTLLSDNGYLVPGYGNKPLVKSRYGNNRKLQKSMSSYLSKYSEDGALKWMHYIDTLGSFTGSETDAQGAIYVIGYCSIRSWYHFNNGDSMQIAMTNTDTALTAGESYNGFLLKVDSTGIYLWHAVFDDNSPYWLGYPVSGGLPNKLIVKNGEIFVTGGFLANLTYVKSDSTERLYTLSNSTYPQDNQNKFLVKIKPDGYLAWKSYAHYNATNGTQPADIAAGLNGDIMLVSDYESQVQFYDSDSTLILDETGVTGGNRSFVMRMNTSGHLIWKTQINSEEDYYDASFSHIATDNAGNAYITGLIQNFSALVPLHITNANATLNLSDTLSGFAIIKFDRNGQYRWSVGAKNPYYGWGNALVYKGGQLYAAGNISNNGQTFSNFAFTSTNGMSFTNGFLDNEFFIVNYDTTGVFKNLGKSGDNGFSHLEPAGLTLDSANNYIITGLTDYSSDSTYIVFNQSFNANGVDVFFAKVSADFCADCSNVSWTGVISSAWDNPQNWSCNTVPGPSTSVTIPGGTPYNPIITAGQSFEVWSLSVATGAMMTVQTGAIFQVLH